MAVKKTELVTQTKQKQKARKPHGGPFLAAAVFCESIMEHKGGGITPLRIIDGMAITVPADAPPDVPSKGNRAGLELQGLIIFRSGDSPGEHMLSAAMEFPDGSLKTPMKMPLKLTNAMYGGINVPLKLTVGVYESGVYFLHVRLDGRLVTKMPLHITVERAKPVELPAPPKGRSSKAKT